MNLPITPITDLAIHKREKDLVVATQGRSFYVLDNLPLLYQMADAEKAGAFLFKPEDAYRTAGWRRMVSNFQQVRQSGQIRQMARLSIII